MVDSVLPQDKAAVRPVTLGLGLAPRQEQALVVDRKRESVDVTQDALQRLRVRYVAFADGMQASREHLLTSLFGCIETYSYVEDDFRFLSRVQGDFDILFVGSHDERRMTRLIRAIAPVIGNRARIALLSLSDAHGRSRIMKSGFDDAIDPAKVPTAEAAARIVAIWTRYGAAREIQAKLRQADEGIAHVAYVDQLTRTEKRILGELVRCAGHEVPFAQLRRLMGLGTQQASMDNLRVVISKLRTKLKMETQINSIRGRGYCLIGNAPSMRCDENRSQINPSRRKFLLS